MLILAQIIHRLFQLMILVVFVQSLLTYFMSPFDPVRMKVDRFVEPFLRPIRRYVRPVGSPERGMFDLSPLILILGLYLLDFLIGRILLAFVS
jgi:YggT family protein